MTHMNVLILLGSLRSDSFNAVLAREVAELLPAGATATIHDGLADLPHYSEDLDADVIPHAAAAFRSAVAAADAVVVITPEYNGAVSSAVKNAVDWASRPFGQGALKGKPTAVLSATGSPRGGEWARENAVRILTVAGAAVDEQTVGVATAHEVLAGGKLEDEKIKAQIRNLLDKLPAQLSA
jgi:NAD(P)H-dependent FMN reductase